MLIHLKPALQSVPGMRRAHSRLSQFPSLPWPLSFAKHFRSPLYMCGVSQLTRDMRRAYPFVVFSLPRSDPSQLAPKPKTCKYVGFHYYISYQVHHFKLTHTGFYMLPQVDLASGNKAASFPNSGSCQRNWGMQECCRHQCSYKH